MGTRDSREKSPITGVGQNKPDIDVVADLGILRFDDPRHGELAARQLEALMSLIAFAQEGEDSNE